MINYYASHRNIISQYIHFWHVGTTKFYFLVGMLMIRFVVYKNRGVYTLQTLFTTPPQLQNVRITFTIKYN